jgi:VIT1/CCC1 family predicted Fe2+/Mn2+ transporter
MKEYIIVILSLFLLKTVSGWIKTIEKKENFVAQFASFLFVSAGVFGIIFAVKLFYIH